MRTRVNKSIVLLMVAVFSMVLLMACGPTQEPDPEPNGETPGIENGVEGNDVNGQIEDEGNQENEIIDPTPDVDTQTVTIYYINNEYVVTGDQNLESVIPVEKQVSIGEKSAAERVVEELQREPEDENLLTELARLTVISVDTAEDTVFVNLANQDLQGGSLQEGLVLQQVVYSLTELEGIDKVQILVEGSKVESLMGHIMIDEPLTR